MASTLSFVPEGSGFSYLKSLGVDPQQSADRGQMER